MYTVSIIIPAFNAESTILRCLDSIRTQDILDVQVIVINDCSTDNTEAIVQGYSGLKIELINNETNSGPFFSRNEGLRVAKGKFVAFLDSDDYWLPSHLSSILKFASLNGEIGFFYSGVLVERNNVFFQRYSIKVVDISSLLMRTPICTSSVVIRRNVLDGIYFKDVFYDDLLFWYEVLLRCGKAVRVDPKTAVYVLTKGSYSSNKVRSSLKVYEMYKEFFGLPFFKRWFYFISYNFFGLHKIIMQKFLKITI